jgi:hypothetical protein
MTAGNLSSAETPASEDASKNSEDLVPGAPSIWSQTVDARFSVGHNDNILLDSSASERSVAITGGLEATVVRLPLDGRQVLLTLTGDYIHYPDGQRVGHEAFLLGLAQVKLDFSPRWQAGLDLQYLFLDQVIDTSITETNSSAALVRGHGITVCPSVRHDLPGGFWLELGLAAMRQFLDEPFDDYWEDGPKFAVVRDHGFRSSASLTYEWKQRFHDTREQVSLSGTNLPGTDLRFQTHAVELALRQNWDEQRRWRTVTRLEFLANQDNGPGYFDYQRYRASQQLRFVAKQWEAKVQARVSYYDFSHQTASDSDPELRAKTLLDISLRAERRLSKQLKLFADYTFEKSLSNRPADEYHVNKVAGGLDCGF